MELRKVRITSIEDIHAGDHVCNRMSNGFWHHEIVTAVYSETYEAVGFMQNRAQYCSLQTKMRSFKADSKEELYKIEYRITDKNITLFTPEKIVERAKLAFNGTLPEVNTTYNIATNNCEHFATWCTTNNCVSFQVQDVKESFGRIASLLICSASLAGPFGLLVASGMALAQNPSSLAVSGSS